jgi:hypothetical protein
VRANARGNSHCAPTVVRSSSGGVCCGDGKAKIDLISTPASSRGFRYGDVDDDLDFLFLDTRRSDFAVICQGIMEALARDGSGKESG